MENNKRLRIAVDFPWDAAAHMGTGAYSETMVNCLARARPDFDITLLASESASKSISLPNVRYINPRNFNLLNECYRQISIPYELQRLNANCLFAPATLLPSLKVCPMICTVHDIVFLEHPEYYSDGLNAYLKKYFVPSLISSDHIIAISQETKAALQRLLRVPEEKVSVIEQPVRRIFQEGVDNELRDSILKSLRIEKPLFFHVSNLAPHKNVPFALRAFGLYLRSNPSSRHTFVIAGGGIAPNVQTNVVALAAELNIGSRIRFLGRVDDETLAVLYQSADAFIYPSLHEGWGLPVAEANALRTSVLASEGTPSAESHQKLPLKEEVWAKALEQCEQRVGLLAAIDHDAVGKRLAALLVEVVNRSKSKLVGRVHSLSKCDTDHAIVAYRADWQSPSGFGEAARSTFRALADSGLNCRPITVPKDKIQQVNLFSFPASSQPLCAKMWIHHVPPDWFSLNESGKHVAIFVWETNRLLMNDSRGVQYNWISALNKLDEIWVPSSFLVGVLRNSRVKAPIKVIPHPIDTHLYCPGAKRNPPCALPSNYTPAWTVFLYVGSWDERKRPDVLVRAFTAAFTAKDHAVLLIKSYVTGIREDDHNILNQWVAECKASDAHVCTIPALLSNDEMVDLYRLANVFVSASCGEGFCLPAVQSMSVGNPVIASGWSAFNDYAQIRVRYELKDVPAKVRFPGYSSDQQWAVISEDDLVEQMKWAHTHRHELAAMGIRARQWVLQNASFQVVGIQLRNRVAELLDVDPETFS